MKKIDMDDNYEHKIRRLQTFFFYKHTRLDIEMGEIVYNPLLIYCLQMEM